jgi:hypothetical protein
MIFLCNNIMDKNLKAVEWTREWIARVGGWVLAEDVRFGEREGSRGRLWRG